MKKYLLLLIFMISNVSYSQVSRTVLDYSINNSKIVRRLCDEKLIFNTEEGDIVLNLYSDSISINRQTFSLLVCYPQKWKENNIRLLITYTDKTEEIVPNFPDIDNCSVYYFLNRLDFIYKKKVDSITFLGIGKFKMKNKIYFIDFLNKIKYPR